MPEGLPSTEINELARLQYYGGVSANLRMRALPYEEACAPIDFYKAAFDTVPLPDNAAVLDVGCDNGSGLLALRKRRGTGDLLVGFDIDTQLFWHTADNSDARVQFVTGVAQRLPFPDSTFDMGSALFMLYHADPERSLQELKRVTRPDGFVVVATSGKGNKAKHRIFERTVAAELGVSPPPVFTEPFDTDIAEEMLPQLFEVVCCVPQICDMRLTHDTAWKYLLSMKSMYSAAKPIPNGGDWARLVEQIVEPAIDEEIEAQGIFTDQIDRRLYICRNRG